MFNVYDLQRVMTMADQENMTGGFRGGGGGDLALKRPQVTTQDGLIRFGAEVVKPANVIIS